MPITTIIESLNPTHVRYSIQHYVIKFVTVLRQVSGFLRVLQFPPNKTDRNDIAETLLKVALTTITLTPIQIFLDWFSLPDY